MNCFLIIYQQLLVIRNTCKNLFACNIKANKRIKILRESIGYTHKYIYIYIYIYKRKKLPFFL